MGGHPRPLFKISASRLFVQRSAESSAWFYSLMHADLAFAGFPQRLPARIVACRFQFRWSGKATERELRYRNEIGKRIKLPLFQTAARLPPIARLRGRFAFFSPRPAAPLSKSPTGES
jgi:hypothetical protein